MPVIPRYLRYRKVYEEELKFDGAKTFIDSVMNECNEYVRKLREEKEMSDEEADVALSVAAGDIVKSMWETVVRTNMSFQEYSKADLERVQSAINERKRRTEEAKRLEREREDKAAEESGYRIL